MCFFVLSRARNVVCVCYCVRLPVVFVACIWVYLVHTCHWFSRTHVVSIIVDASLCCCFYPLMSAAWRSASLRVFAHSLSAACSILTFAAIPWHLFPVRASVVACHRDRRVLVLPFGVFCDSLVLWTLSICPPFSAVLVVAWPNLRFVSLNVSSCVHPVLFVASFIQLWYLVIGTWFIR